VKRETPLALYKGLGAVLTGIVPKMAIRFTSYEWYKQLLADDDGMVTGRSTFLGMCNSASTKLYLFSFLLVILVESRDAHPQGPDYIDFFQLDYPLVSPRPSLS
jgi:solute carrier family 25 citrate transporter 1